MYCVPPSFHPFYGNYNMTDKNTGGKASPKNPPEITIASNHYTTVFLEESGGYAFHERDSHALTGIWATDELAQINAELDLELLTMDLQTATYAMAATGENYSICFLSATDGYLSEHENKVIVSRRPVEQMTDDDILIPQDWAILSGDFVLTSPTGELHPFTDIFDPKNMQTLALDEIPAENKNPDDFATDFEFEIETTPEDEIEDDDLPDESSEDSDTTSQVYRTVDGKRLGFIEDSNPIQAATDARIRRTTSQVTVTFTDAYTIFSLGDDDEAPLMYYWTKEPEARVNAAFVPKELSEEYATKEEAIAEAEEAIAEAEEETHEDEIDLENAPEDDPDHPDHEVPDLVFLAENENYVAFLSPYDAKFYWSEHLDTEANHAENHYGPYDELIIAEMDAGLELGLLSIQRFSQSDLVSRLLSIYTNTTLTSGKQQPLAVLIENVEGENPKGHGRLLVLNEGCEETSDSIIKCWIPLMVDDRLQVDQLGEDSFPIWDGVIDPAWLPKLIDKLNPKIDIVDVIGYEAEEANHDAVISYTETLSPQSQLALNETMRASWGGTEQAKNAIVFAENILKQSAESLALTARQSAVTEVFQGYHAVVQNVSRALGGDPLNDTPLAQLKIDGPLEHVKTVNSELTTLSTAVLEMASMLGVDNISNPQELPIDVPRLVKIVATVSFGAKTWANVYKFAEEQERKNQKTIEGKDFKIAQLQLEIESLSLTIQKIHAEQAAQIVDSKSSFLLFAKSCYLTTDWDQNDDGLIRISPMSVGVTMDRDEAVEFETLDDAQMALDALNSWRKMRIVKMKLDAFDLKPKNFYIGEVVVKKVGSL